MSDDYWLCCIKDNKVYCDALGPEQNSSGKWRGLILLDGKWSPVHRTEAVFASRREAVRAMKTLVRQVKNGASLPLAV